MRVKVETVPPLPHLRAWFSTSALPSVLDLKASLCTDLAPLAQDSVCPEDILLFLDDFELLDASPIDVVRDGDLLIIKKKPTLSSAKRKASTQDATSPARKRVKTDSTGVAPLKRPTSTKPRPPTPQTSSSDSSSTGSSSDSDTDTEDESSSSDSDSDSDSSESDSSSSSSSSSGVPPAQSSRQNTTNRTENAAKPQASGVAKPQNPPVPPGFGKPTTHSRNLRRRRKKMYERLASTVEPASVNEIPLGTRTQTHELVASEAQDEPPRPQPAKGKGAEASVDAANAPGFMMASLQNKNKRRGFKNALSQGVPPKIVFPDSAAVAAAEQSVSAGAGMDIDPDASLVEAELAPAPEEQRPARPESRAAQPRLVPPSEKEALGLLPANMFVTSVDVEEGMWPARGKGGKKKKKKQQQQEARVQEDEAWQQGGEEDSFAGGLPYDDVVEEPVPTTSQTGAGAGNSSSTEHAVVAAQWDTLRKLSDKAQVQAGATVAWKALGINFATLTPEMLLYVGRVVQSDEKLVVQPLTDSGAVEVSFGGIVDPEEAEAEVPAEETFEWTDVFQGDWRLVSAR
ncbi:hypothetical protein C8Q77DRAFT_1086815 [Trametes polyzona]|nr:hypothetical protein C8Q77DRAFT_1086815 [Trametes polyzona]